VAFGVGNVTALTSIAVMGSALKGCGRVRDTTILHEACCGVGVTFFVCLLHLGTRRWTLSGWGGIGTF